MKKIIRNITNIILFFLINLMCSAQTPETKIDLNIEKRLVGTWKGITSCIGSKLPCKSESVIYEIAKKHGANRYDLQISVMVNNVKNRVELFSCIFDTEKLQLIAKSRLTKGIWYFLLLDNKLQGSFIYRKKNLKVSFVNKLQLPIGNM